MQSFPSIFNDVIGPVMRGPSSSHCAAGLRIGRLARDLAGGNIQNVTVEFDPAGSLATTHESQGSDMGLFGGFLGLEADDERLLEAENLLRKAGIQVDIVIRDIAATHPNTYTLTIQSNDRTHTLTAHSVGGGMIEIVEINGFAVSLTGDAFVTLLITDGLPDAYIPVIKAGLDPDAIRIHQAGDSSLIEISGQGFLPEALDATLKAQGNVRHICRLHPVLPVLSHPDMTIPFQSVEEMWVSGNPETPLSEFALDYECARSGLSRKAVLDKMAEINRILRSSLNQGLKGTTFKDRILGCQSTAFRQALAENKLLDGGLLNRIILYVTVFMEVKSSMGVIVAAPTAGACAACPGTLLAAAEILKASEETVARAMLSAGLIGVFASLRTSFAGEVGGCQAETGVAAAMAAAALVELTSGTAKQSLGAASMALQNVLGLVCDPVANRVEAPCLGRNVAAGANALSSANMVLAGFDPLIPFDQVLDAHREISASMPRELRCTALGGLSVTPASKAIEKHLCAGCGVSKITY